MHLRRSASAILAAVSFYAVGGCAGTVRYVPQRTVSACCGEESSDLKVLTYNAGIAPGIVRYASPRTPHIAAALAAQDADIVCIQEAWPEPSVEKIRAAMSLPDDRFYHVDTRGENEHGDTCDPEDMRGIAACAARECAGESEEDFTICALEKCRSEGVMLYLFHRSCLNCLVSSVGHGLDDIWRRCSRGEGASRVYDGGNGVILASRWPLRSREVLRLPSSGANRVALFATVEVPGKGDVEVACTHLSSHAPTSPTHPDFDSWDDEKRTQFMMISQRLRARAGDRPQVFAGDMNFGPAIGDAVHDTSGSVWTRALREGFESPFADHAPPLCTTCADNTLRDSSKSYVIDHVLTRPGAGGRALVPVCAERALDGTMEIAPYGERVRTHLSDHFSVAVSFRLGAVAPP